MIDALATYVHHLDPVIFDIPGTGLAVRWYGLAYVAGFVLGYLMLMQLSKRDLYCIKPEKLGDFITAVALFGVLMGGRFGEFFFYYLPREGWSGFIADPFWVLRVWEGGMASHGGMLGVLLVALIYAKRKGLSFTRVLDGLAIVAPIGIFFGRLANFINGELYGRVCPADSALAVKFPLEITHEILIHEPQKLGSMIQAAAQVAPPEQMELLLSNGDFAYWLFELSQSNELVRNAIEPFLSPRYPSQLFEAASEGLLIFIILITLRFKWKNAPAGIFCALFCLIYAPARIVTEFYREPETAEWLGMTRGQYLSLALALLGLAFLFFALKKGKKEA